MGLMQKLFAEKNRQCVGTAEAARGPRHGGLMLSQYPALFLQEKDASFREDYLLLTEKAGIPREDAARLFDFDCGVIRRFPKQYLLSPGFTRAWVFGLFQPFLLQYPREQEDILRERFLTLSEVCKMIDEAEWHFWNSHERAMPDEVWNEIFAWRLSGQGGRFATRYFEMAAEASGAAEQSVTAFSSREGKFLSRNKWG